MRTAHRSQSSHVTKLTEPLRARDTARPKEKSSQTPSLEIVPFNISSLETVKDARGSSSKKSKPSEGGSKPSEGQKVVDQCTPDDETAQGWDSKLNQLNFEPPVLEQPHRMVSHKISPELALLEKREHYARQTAYLVRTAALIEARAKLHLFYFLTHNFVLRTLRRASVSESNRLITFVINSNGGDFYAQQIRAGARWMNEIVIGGLVMAGWTVGQATSLFALCGPSRAYIYSKITKDIAERILRVWETVTAPSYSDCHKFSAAENIVRLEPDLNLDEIYKHLGYPSQERSIHTANLAKVSETVGQLVSLRKLESPGRYQRTSSQDRTSQRGICRPGEGPQYYSEGSTSPLRTAEDPATRKRRRRDASAGPDASIATPSSATERRSVSVQGGDRGINAGEDVAEDTTDDTMDILPSNPRPATKPNLAVSLDTLPYIRNQHIAGSTGYPFTLEGPHTQGKQRLLPDEGRSPTTSDMEATTRRSTPASREQGEDGHESKRSVAETVGDTSAPIVGTEIPSTSIQDPGTVQPGAPAKQPRLPHVESMMLSLQQAPPATHSPASLAHFSSTPAASENTIFSQEYDGYRGSERAEGSVAAAADAYTPIHASSSTPSYELSMPTSTMIDTVSGTIHPDYTALQPSTSLSQENPNPQFEERHRSEHSALELDERLPSTYVHDLEMYVDDEQLNVFFF